MIIIHNFISIQNPRLFLSSHCNIEKLIMDVHISAVKTKLCFYEEAAYSNFVLDLFLLGY